MYIGNVIIPIDFPYFSEGFGQPPPGFHRGAWFTGPVSTRHGRVRHGHRTTAGGQYPAAAAGSSAASRPGEFS